MARRRRAPYRVIVQAKDQIIDASDRLDVFSLGAGGGWVLILLSALLAYARAPQPPRSFRGDKFSSSLCVLCSFERQLALF